MNFLLLIAAFTSVATLIVVIDVRIVAKAFPSGTFFASNVALGILLGHYHVAALSLLMAYVQLPMALYEFSLVLGFALENLIALAVSCGLLGYLLFSLARRWFPLFPFVASGSFVVGYLMAGRVYSYGTDWFTSAFGLLQLSVVVLGAATVTLLARPSRLGPEGGHRG